MWRDIRAYFFTIITLAASIAGLYMFNENLFSDPTLTSVTAISFVGFFAILFFLESLFLKIKWGRARLYAEVLPIVNKAFYEIHKLEWDEFTLSQKKDAFNRFCENLSKAFSIITGVSCSVCVKVLVGDPTDSAPEVLTFARDETSRRIRPSASEAGIHHMVSENTDFASILAHLDSPSKNYFFNNQLPFCYYYKNTSFKLYTKPYDGAFRDFVRFFKWPLPYKSTVVVPICPLCDARRPHLRGFLCIDSSHLLTFRKNHDLTVMQGVADGIYKPLHDVWETP